MTSLNELAITFKNILDDLFNSNGFECKKLFYGDEVFYCGRDILKCLNYSEDRGIITKTLEKLNSNKFTIDELQEKYLSLSFKYSDDINKELIDSLNQYERKHIYINKQGLYRLIGSSKKLEAKPFQDFIYDVLLPALDSKYKELLKSEQEKNKELHDMIKDQNLKINELLKNSRTLIKNTEILKEDNKILKEDNNIINEELNEIKETQENIIQSIENNLIPNRNLPPADDKLKHSFVIYKINDDVYYCLRGQHKYVQNKLIEIDPKNIIINNFNNPNPIDFYQKFKEESKRRLEILKERIINSLYDRIENFNENSLKGKKLINYNLEKLKEFTIRANNIYLNNSTIDDLLKFYNSLIEEKNGY